MLIETKELTYTYSGGTPWEHIALKGINLSLRKGDFMLIAGPSGSGKSTLVQHFIGLLEPSRGWVVVDGWKLSSGKEALRRARRQVGLVFQIPEQQFFSEDVFTEVAFAPENLGLDREEISERVKSSLELVGLDYSRIKGCSPFNLSAGQQRLVAIASILALKPEVLVLDEPTAGLDSGSRRHLTGLLKRLQRQEGLTIVVASHCLEEFLPLADSIYFLDRGSLVFSGSAEQLCSDSTFAERYKTFLPPVTKIMHRLALNGAQVGTKVFDLESARREIMAWWREEGD